MSSLSEAEVAALFAEGLSKRRGMAFFRVGVVCTICLVFMGIGLAVGGAFLCISWFVAGAVALAFIFEAFRNLGGSMLFVVGRVTESGWVTDSDGGPGDGAALRMMRVPRVKVDVEELFVRAPNGQRSDDPAVPRPFVIEMPQWLERVKVDQRVALVCLPSSTDPVHWKILS